MGRFKYIWLMVWIGVLTFFISASNNTAEAIAKKKLTAGKPVQETKEKYAGSKSCQECHERFYQLWSTSFHGMAMQTYTLEFAYANLIVQSQPLSIGNVKYQIDINQSVMVEQNDKAEKRYLLQYVMGGKYVYYFLTTLEDGRLQTLPVAYDTRKKEWFDTTLSGVRHIPGRQPGVAMNWMEAPYTFNVSCRDCHVSQRESSYDMTSDTFKTNWKEPGINCETCHGPSDEHNRVMRSLPKGKKPKDYKILRTKTFTAQQHNDSCNSCHAKSARITAGYRAPEPFFDHFELITLEDPDYFPDGRDLGENYTKTSWMLNPCAGKSSLNCVTCHTSSGRYRFRKPEDANKACLPCHAKRVGNVAAHSRHPAESAGSRCIACHMPKTGFARMSRSDHSMLPPTPSATIKYNSPNACNICHADKDAVWADRQVRKWFPRDYQLPVLKRAELIEAARNKNWDRLPDMLAYIQNPDRNEVFSASLIRLMGENTSPLITSALLRCISDSSPMVRTAAIDILAMTPTSAVLQALIAATGDSSRVVRIAAAGALANFPELSFTGDYGDRIKRATEEYLVSLKIFPTNWAAHFKLGNYYLGRDRLTDALDQYDLAAKFNPNATMVLVNTAIVHSKLGEIEKAKTGLLNAVKLDHNLAVAHYNLGMLTAGQGEVKDAEMYFAEALRADPMMVEAAFNLCILRKERPTEALEFCTKAVELQPSNPKYAISLAVLLRDSGDVSGAVSALSSLIERVPTHGEAYLMMGELLFDDGKPEEAVKVYRRLLTAGGVIEHYRRAAQRNMDQILAKEAGGNE